MDTNFAHPQRCTISIPEQLIESVDVECDEFNVYPQITTRQATVKHRVNFKPGVFVNIRPYKLSDWGFDIFSNNLPDKVFFNTKKKTTVLLKNDEVTKVKCDDKEKFSKRIGFLEAYFQMTCGMSKTQALKYLEELEKDNSNDYEFVKLKGKHAK